MRKLIHPLFFIVLISFALSVGTLRRGHEWGDDFAWYILQAQSIVNGAVDEFMETSEFINTQSTMHLGPLAYPWGYPLILVPFYAIWGISPLALKIPSVLFYMGFLVCLYFWMNTRFTRTESLLAVSLFAFNPMLILFEDQILSDIPFLFFSTLSLLLMTVGERRNIFHGLLIGVSVFFTTFLRATGILLLGSFLILEFFQLWRHRRERETVLSILRSSFVICSTFAVLFVAAMLLFPSGGESYLAQYSTTSLQQMYGFAIAYFKIFGRFFGEGEGWLYLYYFVFIFFLLGVWKNRREGVFFIVFFVLWMLVHIPYPYWQGPRYIFPLLPIFIYFAFEGMKLVVAMLPRNYASVGRGIFFGFWVLMAGVFLFQSGINAYENLRSGRQINGPFDPYSIQVYEYIKEKTPPESIVIFFKPRAMRLMTGHLSLMIYECEEIHKGDYLVLSKKVGETGQIPPERIASCGLPLNEVLENRRFIVYEIQKAGLESSP
ncbi:MAG TPA: glycosyltransferase family 39 protein [Anaerolineales bacterium]|nr:glycosyltransferase family 39 protein [Anaerolineales bacterium]